MKIKTLFLASNPSETQPLKLNEEIRSITEKIRASDHRDVVELTSIWAVRPDDLLQSLNVHKPTIVHFSGHGSQAGEIMLMGSNRQSKPVSAAALKKLFTVFKDNICLVVLNACYSKQQAQAISEVIDCVVGMNKAIGDDAAIVFAASFYRAIGFGHSIKRAFDEGVTALMVEGIAEENTPELIVRQGINPGDIYLITPSTLSANASNSHQLYVCAKCSLPFKRERDLSEHLHNWHSEPVKKAPMKKAQSMQPLHRAILDYFSLGEIRAVCFDLEIDDENIPDREQGKELFIWQLLQYLRRRGQLLQFVDACKSARPNVDWDSLTQIRIDDEIDVDQVQPQSVAIVESNVDADFKLSTMELEKSIDDFLKSDVPRYKWDGPHKLVFMDLDKFTGINKRFGSKVADEVIKIVWKAFADLFFGSSSHKRFVVRWEQDEFIAVSRSFQNPPVELSSILLNYLKNYNWSLIAPGLYVNASIGIAEHQTDEPAASFIIRAIYGASEAKRVGGGKIFSAPITLASNVSKQLIDYGS